MITQVSTDFRRCFLAVFVGMGGGCLPETELEDPTDSRAYADVTRYDRPFQDSTAHFDRGIIDTTLADAFLPDARTNDTGSADTTLPDATGPDSSTFDATLPDLDRPDTKRPDSSLPDTWPPDTTWSPDTTVADAPPPDASAPDAWFPDSTAADASTLDARAKDAGHTDGADAATADSSAEDILIGDTAWPEAAEDVIQEDAVAPDRYSEDVLTCTQEDGGSICDPLACCSGHCSSLTFANLCDNSRISVLHDENGLDAEAADAMGAALGAFCTVSPSTAHETDPAVLDQQTYRPLLTTGNTLLVAGGTYAQQALDYMEQTLLTPVYSDDDFPTVRLRQRGSDDLLLEINYTTDLSLGHDYFVLQLMVEPIDGSLMVAAYGIEQAGTAAAVWYFENAVLAGNSAESYYVVEWTDGDANQTPDINDDYTILATSPP